MTEADKKQFREIFGHDPVEIEDSEPADFSGATDTGDR